MANPAKQTRALTFSERVAYQRAIEEVYWRHRIWPKENRAPKPSLDAVISQAQLEKKVADYLRNFQALEDYGRSPITVEQLQGELDRMARCTKQPDILHELFEALRNDPFAIAECLAKPILAERLMINFSFHDKEPLSSWGAKAEIQMPTLAAAANASYTLPIISAELNECIYDSWTATSTTNAPTPRSSHTAVWTGSEMIVWGGYGDAGYVNTGGRYDPSTDSWTPTSTTNAPDQRTDHTAVWTGNEMIVWDGYREPIGFNTGGRYNPITDTWTATSTVNAPDARVAHTAVWTGSEMIVWGGNNAANTGGRYDPNTDSWTATSTINAPDRRFRHTSVWTGSEISSGAAPAAFFLVTLLTQAGNTIRLWIAGHPRALPTCLLLAPITQQSGPAVK